MKDKLIQFFLLGCGSLEEAEKELDRSVREVQKKTGFNEKLSLQKIAELEKNHVGPPSSQDEALSRYSVSGEVPR